jgi:hypothetical protein
MATVTQRVSPLARCVLSALTLVALLVAPAAASSLAATDGSIGVRLVDVPADAQDDPRARIYIVDHLAPGTEIIRRIEISNSTGNTTRVELYAAAAGIENGSFLGADGHTPNDLSTWTKVTPEAIDLPPGGRQMATVTITVPGDAAPGEQYGVIWAEARSAPSEGSGSSGGGDVTQVNRVGIRLYISVGPGGPTAADFTIDSLTAERSADGRPMILAAVHNTGGRALDMNGTLELLNGPGALSAGPFPAILGTTLGRGDTESVVVALDPELPAGPWDATITLRSGLVERTAEATITFPEAGAAAPVETTSGFAGWMYVAIAALLLLMLGIAAMVVVRRVRRARRTPSGHVPVRRARPVRTS